MRYGFLMSLVVISLAIISFHTSHAETINYFYDDLHRLIRVEFESGVAIEYTYDQYGNRKQEIIIPESVPPTTTASPPGGNYQTSQPVTLTCDDGPGSACDKIYGDLGSGLRN
jgi:YD repeat-containing protein